MPHPPSGEQFEIALGAQRATIVEVGGGIREYFVGDRAVLDPYPREAICDGAHGAPLIPWPNRLADGRYDFDGSGYQLALTEPGKRNAIHGLLRWQSWRVLERSGERVEMGIRLAPQPGWPFAIEVSVDYALGENGLSVLTRAHNSGHVPCPFGCGQHPYLSPGEGLIDSCTVELRAATRIVTDPERQLPVGREPVRGTSFDFTSPRLIGDQEIDFALTDLERDADGRVWVRMGCPDGRTVELWADDSYKVIQLYTGDKLAPARRRRGLAAEPMTCPANALRTGEDLVRLEPGNTHVCRWGVRLAA